MSDWSADVCSSDLIHGTYGCGDRFLKLLGAHPAEIAAQGRAGRLGKLPRIGAERRDAANLLGDPLGDRNSVVSGKSVSVRVDLGGRRISKNKTEGLKA